jgi:hypothetical protein
LEIAPKDGVHRANSDGYICGAKAHVIDDRICPHGMTAFMYGNTKVFYSLKNGLAANEWSVRKSADNQRKLAGRGLSLTAYGITEVELCLTGCYGEINTKCFGFDTATVPITARLVEYFEGKPYRWNGDDNPKAFLAFADKASEIIREKVPSLATRQYLKDIRKIGNILWHEKHQCYYIVDCG